MSNPITTAINLVHKLDNDQLNYAEHMEVLESKYSDTGLMFDGECPHCKAGAKLASGACSCGCEWCPTHLCILGEGGYCAACEAIADIQQAIGMRNKYYVNHYYMMYYNQGRANWRTGRVQPNNLVKYIEYCWNLSYEQCLLDLMQDGYSMCVVSPMIIAIHKRMDREYAEYEASRIHHEANQENELMDFVSKHNE